jgi:hypothetical protein
MQRADYEQALKAARQWIAEHGRYPQQLEWEYQAPDHADHQTALGLGAADAGGGRERPPKADGQVTG